MASHAQDYIKVNIPGCPSASIGNSIIRLKTSSSATFFPQKKNISRGETSINSIRIPSSMPVSKIKPNTNVIIVYLAF